MAYHSFLVEPISCHAWNKDRTREWLWVSALREVVSREGCRTVKWKGTSLLWVLARGGVGNIAVSIGRE